MMVTSSSRAGVIGGGSGNAGMSGMIATSSSRVGDSGSYSRG